ncbi:large ribosomal RNA subunit accumulation protein YCED homolog 2, chloroplastic isoform X2 [Magnolia sinica]|uniref:large ribosomal RNA subunit accumulation protein YCED homolog 2, chloroplastic isoform X2 n=1 Tax=Magnolia sinica TaxID=86752 RepID=UPI002659A253|nr:large ribosomal RNA subunit accumulation protein YCED homolog 2, chloroplastic isoform X2 [Magnolia sinica]
MEKACYSSVSRFIHHRQIPSSPNKPKAFAIPFLPSTSKIEASSRKDDFSLYTKKNTRKRPRTPRRLITISTSDGKWHGQWTYDYIFSLRELQVADLAEDGQKDAEVSISLSIDKHAGFGFSVDGRIITSFTRKCCNCSASYCREIDTTFDVWVLPSSKDNRELQLPEIGGDDPSVIYVKPGSEADLDSLIQDTIRLAISVKDTCSESCEKSPPSWHYIGGKEAYVDKRWSRLMELRNVI